MSQSAACFKLLLASHNTTHQNPPVFASATQKHWDSVEPKTPRSPPLCDAYLPSYQERCEFFRLEFEALRQVRLPSRKLLLLIFALKANHRAPAQKTHSQQP